MLEGILSVLWLLDLADKAGRIFAVLLVSVVAAALLMWVFFGRGRWK